MSEAIDGTGPLEFGLKLENLDTLKSRINI